MFFFKFWLTTEAAIKFARRYFYSKGQKKRIEFCVLIIVSMEEL